MRKSFGLGLLALLVLGMVQTAAFAHPPQMNGRVWQNNSNRCDYDYRDRLRDRRQAERARWQLQRQRLAEQRRIANWQHRDRMRALRVAGGPYYNDRPGFRW